jgi:hypothetical protein
LLGILIFYQRVCAFLTVVFAGYRDELIAGRDGVIFAFQSVADKRLLADP